MKNIHWDRNEKPNYLTFSFENNKEIFSIKPAQSTPLKLNGEMLEIE